VLVTSGNLFLRKALEVNSLVNLQVTSAMPAKFDPEVLYVFHRQLPPQMPPGRSLVIDPAAASDLWQLGEKLENPIVTKQDPDSPLMRHVRLDNVLLPEARQLVPGEGAKHLVTALSGDPLYFSIERGSQKVLVLSVNLDQGDLTFRTAFPIMLTNALGWFAGTSGELRESLASGAVSEIEIPATPADGEKMLWAMRSPSGRLLPLPPGATKASVGPLDECGVWTLVEQVSEAATPAASRGEASGSPAMALAGSPAVELACNLASRAESDLRMPEKLLDARPQAALATSWLARPIWFYLAVLVWLLLVVEWFLYQRRWIS
jgi:hypothetical protein